MGTSFVLASMARLHFGVTLPTDRATLKTAYRQAARKLHTDTSGSDTKAAFQDMQAAYEALTAPGAAGVFTDAPVDGLHGRGYAAVRPWAGRGATQKWQGMRGLQRARIQYTQAPTCGMVALSAMPALLLDTKHVGVPHVRRTQRVGRAVQAQGYHHRNARSVRHVPRQGRNRTDEPGNTQGLFGGRAHDAERKETP